MKKNLPKNTKASVNTLGELVLSNKVGKNTVQITFNMAGGFNYTVNGSYDMGTVKDKKDQVRVALAVKNNYDAFVKSLPSGTVIKTSAYNEDGNGDYRSKAYMRIGFGAPDRSGYMWSKKEGDRMVPSSSSESENSSNNPDTVYFSEKDRAQSVKDWFEIISGKGLVS